MNDRVGIDSNTLTYLVESMDPGYNPTADLYNLAYKRISLLRIYLYGAIPFHIVPTVTKEYQKIKIKLRKDTHESLCKILLLDEPWSIAENGITQRITEQPDGHERVPQDTFSDELQFEISKSSFCFLTCYGGTRQLSGRYMS